jgi:hypothetical protein
MAAILMGIPTMVYMLIITISLNPSPPGTGATELIQSIMDRDTTSWRMEILYPLLWKRTNDLD